MDPIALEEFREIMSWLFEEGAAEAAAGLLEAFFGPGETVESVTAMTNDQFFAGFLRAIMAQAEAAGSLSLDRLEVIGSVPEGDDVVHVLTRNFVSVGELSIEQLEPISLARHGETWRVLLSGKLKGLGEQLRQAMSR